MYEYLHIRALVSQAFQGQPTIVYAISLFSPLWGSIVLCEILHGANQPPKAAIWLVSWLGLWVAAWWLEVAMGWMDVWMPELLWAHLRNLSATRRRRRQQLKMKTKTKTGGAEVTASQSKLKMRKSRQWKGNIPGLYKRPARAAAATAVAWHSFYMYQKLISSTSLSKCI